MKNIGYKAVKPVINLLKPALKSTLMREFSRMKPRVSETEQQVLEIGDVGVEGEIYEGNVDWKEYLSRDKNDLTAEEQAFIDGPVEELCRMVDDYEVFDSAEQDISPQVWDFILKNKFLGMIIPKEYGGLEFSAKAHSEVVHKLGSRSFTAAISVMVPNSLGPAELILHYGTQEQKDHWLPRLAAGKEIPCFGLTEPNVGSDATSIETTGTVKLDDDGKPYLHIENLNKRYITLAPVATIIGLAVNVKDPDNILGKGEEPGITVALVKRDTPGLKIGNRHKGMEVPFQNGPIRCEDGGIKVSVEDSVVGGAEGVGKGWPMLVTLLSVGRGISLPSLSVSGMKTALRVSSAYGRVRKQFGMPVGEFEGVKKVIGEMAGLTYLSEATRVSTLRTIDSGMIPSVATAMVKYHLTEHLRKAINDGMDILGGKAVMYGPQNMLQRAYKSIPIAITVEGANLMGRNFMIFGQGSVRAHPYLLDEIAATDNPDKAAGENELWDLLINKHIPNLLDNTAVASSLGRKKPVNSVEGYKEQIKRLSAAFNVCANLSVITIGEALKAKENLGARMGDMMSYLYMATCALEQFERDGSPEEDRPLVDWACQWSLEKAEAALAEFIPNYEAFYNEMGEGLKAKGKSIPPVIRLLNTAIRAQSTLPKGQRLSKPSDKLALDAANVAMTPGEARDRLTSGLFLEQNAKGNDPVATLEEAFKHVLETDHLESRVRKAVKAGVLESHDLKGAVEAGVISSEEAGKLEKTQELVSKVVNVDDFGPEEFKPK